LVALPFSDKFDDSLTFNKWAGTTIQPAGAGIAEVVSLNPNSLPNHARFVINALDGWVYSSVKQAIASNIVYARGYFLLNSYPAAQDDYVNLILLAGTSGLAYAGVSKRWDGSLRWQLIGRGTGGTYPTVVATTGPAVGDGYHSIELHWELSTTAPILEMFVDGVSVAVLTLATHPTLNTTEFGTCTVASFGIAEKTGSAYALDVYVDDCAIDTQYIGPTTLNPKLNFYSSPELHVPIYFAGSVTPIGNTPVLNYDVAIGIYDVRVDEIIANHIFKQWSDGITTLSRSLNVTGNTDLTAIYMNPKTMPFMDTLANRNNLAPRTGNWTTM